MRAKLRVASVLDDNYISLKKTFLAKGKGRRPDLSHQSVRRSRRNCFFNCTVCVPRARTHGCRDPAPWSLRMSS
ncbi:hypothetical protein RRG08_004608 [Elysia crispata]|uniref:Uncharacterized protein n=1 Tax=Elysia crispata TaxID=231223 RepID=A0AAE1E1M6_9GAST|nr:hypothetical protein RRG08_004608 [Elysia crispata]